MTISHAHMKALPEVTPLTRHYWEALKAHELKIQHCGVCDKYVFYPRARCSHCGKDALQWVRACGRATLHSYIINYVAPPGWEQEVPYVVAAVRLEEGPLMMSNLRGVAPRPEELVLDMPLQLAFEAREEFVLPVFEPCESKKEFQ